MKFLIATIMLLSISWTQAEETNTDETTATTYARSEYISGRGSSSGFCQNNNSFFCVDSLKQRAESDAQRDARWTCDSRGGRAAFSGTCSTYCTPSYIPPDGGNTYVSCRADCNLRCDYN